MAFVTISAVMSGVSSVRKIFEEAEKRREREGVETCLFVDEIHRFNKAQQDSFLPKVEEGLVTLVGATTENPSFEMNAAMLSRMRVFVLRRLDEAALLGLLSRAEKHLGKELPLTDSARALLVSMADGDGRYLLNSVEDIKDHRGDFLTEEGLLGKLQRRRPLYDKGADHHYNLISALHKSLRGSDTDASLYWLARMLEGGDDPLYIARRLVRFAYEDVGLADPEASVQALAAWDTWHRLGSPEGDIALAHAVIYLATAPKSNRAYRALGKAQKSARLSGSLMPPKSILNAPTALMKREGYGEGYVYDHDTPEGFSGGNFFPDGFEEERYYKPVERGFEREIKKRLLYWEKLKESFGRKGGKGESKG
jgi:putative ATPase